MHNSAIIPIWKSSPFIRLLLPLVSGILLQWIFSFGLGSLLIVLLLSVFLPFTFFLMSIGRQFQVHAFRGILINIFLITLGMLVTWQKDSRHNRTWFGHRDCDSSLLLVKINEPLVDKPKSFKAEATVKAIIHGERVTICSGKILVYFSKDSCSKSLAYGDLVLIRKKLQPIKNSGNPGAFNYERYAGFQQVFHNVFVKESDWLSTHTNEANLLRQFIFNARKKILTILQNKVAGKDELGIAEALLIGYTNDLDKDLVQAYSNTGVVHIIAISGMHLGLIYVLLAAIFRRLPFIKSSKSLQVFLIISCLWLFSLLTGASASVVRAAVMFTFIAFGSSVDRKASIYNSLAASAFVMLCYNPFFLWDVGFQLSYLAVVGIIVFQKPVYNWFFIPSKWADAVWKLAAVSIAAQVLTFPVCIFYFHQFPNLFLFTNLVAVPLSSIILYAEICLVCFAEMPVLGVLLGKLVALLLQWMNAVILWFSKFPYAVWDSIPATLVSTCVLYLVVISGSAWLMNRNKTALKIFLVTMLAFVVVQAQFEWQSRVQQKIIVYNIPQHTAIDFIAGTEYRFVGDSSLEQDGGFQNFYLKPARESMRVLSVAGSLSSLRLSETFIQFHDIKMLHLTKPLHFHKQGKKISVDLIVLSHGARVSIRELTETFDCTQYIFDASNSLWKIDKWRKECEELHLRSYSVPELGAFVLDAGENHLTRSSL